MRAITRIQVARLLTLVGLMALSGVSCVGDSKNPSVRSEVATPKPRVLSIPGALAGREP
jgi:hypothetical protein